MAPIMTRIKAMTSRSKHDEPATLVPLIEAFLRVLQEPVEQTQENVRKVRHH